MSSQLPSPAEMDESGIVNDSCEDSDAAELERRSLVSLEFDARHLFNNPALADVTIKYAGKEIRAHRVILSIRSEWFNNVLGPNAESKEGKTGIVQLEQSSEYYQALDDMLHWIYGYHYCDSDIIKYTDPDDWDRHLEAAIVAAEYGVLSLEEAAMELCECYIETFAREINVLHFATCALKYPDKRGLLTHQIPKLFDRHFSKWFRDETFRSWLARYPKVKQELVDKHFSKLIKTQEFREYLKTDGEMALSYIDRLTETVAQLSGVGTNSTDEKEAKKRKVG